MCSALLFSDDLFSVFFHNSPSQNSGRIIGEIVHSENDVRRRLSSSFTWNKADLSSDIHSGDSVFTGKRSKLKIKVANGKEIALEQNSLIKFISENSVQIPNMVFGNFKLNIQGKMRIAAQGEILEFDGSDAQVEVVFSKNKSPEIRLVKGNASVRSNNRSVTLEKNKSLALNTLTRPVMNMPVVDQEAVVAIAGAPIYRRTDELYDFFEKSNGALVQRAMPKQLVAFAGPVKWENKFLASTVYGELSTDREFTAIVSTFSESQNKKQAFFAQTVRGGNFYRLSVDGKTWSNPHQFTVESLPLDDLPPQITVAAKTVYLLGQDVQIHGTVGGIWKNYLLELSTSPEFTRASTKVSWQSTAEISLNATQPQTLYLRVRGVNERLQLSHVSDTRTVKVVRPPFPEAPQLAKSKIRIPENTPVSLHWDNSHRLWKYDVRITDSAETVLKEETIQNSPYSLNWNKAGIYQVAFTAQDQFGRKAKKVSRAIIEVYTPETTAPVHARNVSSVPVLSQTFSSKPAEYNRNYLRSRFSVETGQFSMFSADQASQGTTSPSIYTLGLRWLQWKEHHGLEGLAKAKVAGSEDAASGSNSPLHVEARYRYRWYGPSNPLHSLIRSELSFIAGYEYYKNSGTQLFSPGYNLAKVGLGVLFPFYRYWDLSGEALVGYGFDSSQKYELTGNLNYYFDRKWAVGGGYRLHLFEAGSVKTASPLGLPYREGLGEGFMVIRWHY